MLFPDGRPNGVALGRMTRLKRPEVKVLFVARSDTQEHTEGLGEFLPSPVTASEIVETVRKMLAAQSRSARAEVMRPDKELLLELAFRSVEVYFALAERNSAAGSGIGIPCRLSRCGQEDFDHAEPLRWRHRRLSEARHPPRIVTRVSAWRGMVALSRRSPQSGWTPYWLFGTARAMAAL